MSKRSLLILNRKSCARADLRAVVKAAQADHAIDVIIPWSRKDLRRHVRKAVKKGVKRIIAGGGDGTLNKVVGAIMRLDDPTAVTLGLIPLGTANDFARSYGDQGADLAASLEAALTLPGQLIDLGTANGVPFVNVASGGFGAMITATTPLEVKARFGGLAYTLQGLARLGEAAPVAARVSLDGGPAEPVAIAALAIGNNRYAGGGFDVAPHADLADGQLDFAVLSPEGLINAREHWHDASEPGDVVDDLVFYTRFRTALIETERDFHLNLDGEPMVARRFEIAALPGAIRFALPGAR